MALNTSPSHAYQTYQERKNKHKEITHWRSPTCSETRNANEKRRDCPKREAERFERFHNWESREAGNKEIQTSKPNTMDSQSSLRSASNESQEASQGSKLKVREASQHQLSRPNVRCDASGAHQCATRSDTHAHMGELLCAQTITISRWAHHPRSPDAASDHLPPSSLPLPVRT